MIYNTPSAVDALYYARQKPLLFRRHGELRLKFAHIA